MLSVIVPAYAEGESIESNLRILRDSLEKLGVDWEVIVVSDGNTDDTAANARRFDDARVRVIEYMPNRGKGFAVRTGAEEARGDWIAFIDADMEIHPDGLGPLLRRVQRDADVAVGSKRHPESELNYPLFRRVQSRVYQTAVHALFKLTVGDTQTGLKVYRGDALRAVLPLLTIDGFAFDLEWLVMLGAAGATIAEGPVRIQYTFETTTGSSAVRAVIGETRAIHRRLGELRRAGRIPKIPPRVAAPTMSAAVR